MTWLPYGVVNHFAHAWVASRQSPEPRFLLGAILPDLSAFLRIRLPEMPDSKVRAGIAFHHATDRVFHALPAFRAYTRAGSTYLVRRGLTRGPARAAAHVGIELLLDAWLSRHRREALQHYRTALWHCDTLEFPLDTRDRTRISAFAQRLAIGDPATGLEAPGEIARRIARTLEPRPRLRLPEAQLEPLNDWLARAQDGMGAAPLALVHETLSRLDLVT